MTTSIATIKRELGSAAARAREAVEKAAAKHGDPAGSTDQDADDAVDATAGKATAKAAAKAAAVLAASVENAQEAGHHAHPDPVETEIVVVEWPTPSGETPDEIGGVADVANGAGAASSAGTITLSDDAIIGGTEAVLVLGATVEPDAATATGELLLTIGDDVTIEAATSAAVSDGGGRASVSVSVTASDAAVVVVSGSAGSDAFGAAADFVLDLF